MTRSCRHCCEKSIFETENYGFKYRYLYFKCRFICILIHKICILIHIPALKKLKPKQIAILNKITQLRKESYNERQKKRLQYIRLLCFESVRAYFYSVVLIFICMLFLKNQHTSAPKSTKQFNRSENANFSDGVPLFRRRILSSTNCSVHNFHTTDCP